MPSLPRWFFPLYLLLSAALLFPPSSHSGQTAALEIREILVLGNKMVDEATIRTRITSQEGSPFDPEQVTRDVRSIHELGFFRDIKVDAEGFEGGLRLTFRVEEKPIVKSIAFDGNNKVSESDLREKLEFTTRSVYRSEAVAQAIQQLREIYREKGYFRAEIDSKAEPLGRGEVQVVFLIDEGEKHRISTVNFTGHKAFSEEELRGQIKTRKRWLLSWITGSGRLVEEVLQEDRQRLLAFYNDHGYLEARIGKPEVSIQKKKRRIEVLFPVTEGLQYRLGSLELTGDTLVPLEKIKQIMKSREGEIFRRSTFSRDLFNVNQLYTVQGYAYVKVDYTSRLNPELQSIDVVLQVDKGELARIGRIVITGNLATRDKVVRRNITFKEGDIFNSAELRKSRRKIMNLGFFELVDIVPRPREENVIDIDIELKERLTGAFSLGLGYSSEDLLAGQLRLSESNLFGRGQSLQALAEYGSVRKSFSITFSEPAVFDSKYSLGIKLYNTSKDYDEYDRKSVGGRITVGRSLWEHYRGFISLKHETIDITDVGENASTAITDQEGKKTTNSLGLTLVRDSRDNFFNPTKGNRTVLAGEYAGGPFGGDNDFTKLTAESSQYFPLWWQLVFMMRGRFGIVDGFHGQDPPIYERFFLGGLYSVRGFESRSIGPRDETTGDALGGYKDVIFNFELIVPLEAQQGLNMVFFFDAGNAWDKEENVDLGDLRTGAGMGIRWLSPLGPFRLEWGWNLNRRDDEPSGDWGFAIGTFF